VVNRVVLVMLRSKALLVRDGPLTKSFLAGLFLGDISWVFY
jgi:hypothetical protein